MKVIQDYSDSVLLNSPAVITQRFQKSIYPFSTNIEDCVRSKLHKGKTVVLFSGSWRFDFDATYLEVEFFKNNTISLKDNTFFVDPNNIELLDKIMYDQDASNILILHSAFFCNYQTLDTIINQARYYQKFCSKQVILSIPQYAVNFNRLKHSTNDIAQQYQAEIIDDSFIIQLSSL
jgi:hypothetical protein